MPEGIEPYEPGVVQDFPDIDRHPVTVGHALPESLGQGDPGIFLVDLNGFGNVWYHSGG